VIELGQDRDHRVIGRLNGEIVEIAARGVAMSGCAAPHFEPSLIEQKCVETPDGVVAAPPDRVERLDPGLRLPVKASGTTTLWLPAREGDDLDRRG